MYLFLLQPEVDREATLVYKCLLDQISEKNYTRPCTAKPWCGLGVLSIFLLQLAVIDVYLRQPLNFLPSTLNFSFDLGAESKLSG